MPDGLIQRQFLRAHPALERSRRQSARHGGPRAHLLLVAAYAKPWPGAIRISDDQSGAGLAELSRPAMLGRTVSVLEPGPLAVWDRGGVLEIELGSGHLADLPESAVLTGGNRIAVQTAAGWEIIGFAGAELVAPRRYRLTRLLRGLEGSDAAMAPIAAGQPVLVLDGRAGMLKLEPHRIGESRVLRCHAGPMDAAGQAVPISPDAGPALPLAPVHLRAARLADGAIGLGWTRRSRADGDGWGLAEPPLDHAPERWRLRIFRDGAALRTMETGSAGALYGPGEQSADFGGPAGHFTFTIAQISPVLGAGHAATGAFHG